MTQLVKDQNDPITIKAYIIGTSEKSREVDSFGNINTGEMIGYFKASYEQLGTTYYVETGDIIVRDGEKFRVEEIVANYRISGDVVYKKARLMRI